MSRKNDWSFSRIPLDFASLFSQTHIPLFEETPVSEVLEVVMRVPRDRVLSSDRTTELVAHGLESATTHVKNDYNQLYAFEHEWKSGRYFATNTGAGSLNSRASSIWYDADKYLEISRKIRATNLPENKLNYFLGKTSDKLAESTLDLATKILKQTAVTAAKRKK